MVLALISLGAGFHLSDDGGSKDTHGWLVIASMMFYLFAFGIGMSSVPWTVNAEIYPMHARSLGTSASTTVNWVGNAVVSATFLSLARRLGNDRAFWLYATIGIAGWVWLFVSMPETKGLSLEEIESLFARPGDVPRPSMENLSLTSAKSTEILDSAAMGDSDAGHSGGFALLDGNSSDNKKSGISAPVASQGIMATASWARGASDGQMSI